MYCDFYVECVPVVQPAGDECLGDGLTGVDWEPPEDLLEHVMGEETGVGDCVDLLLHRQLDLQDDAEVTGVVRRGWGGTEFRRLPRVIPWRGVVPEDEFFHLVCVEFETAVLHPVSNTLPASVEVGSAGRRVF